MKRQAKLFVSTFLLMLAVLCSADALATNNGNDSSGRNSYDNDRNHDYYDRDHNDYDRDRDDHDWDRDDHDWDRDDHDGNHGNGSKTYICHRTSSSSNSYVLIQVASSAKQAHYDHGDPVQFADSGNGKCRPSTPPAPEPRVKLNLPDYAYVGQAVTATWTSTNATACKLGSATVPVNGSAPAGPYSSAGTKTLTITCTGAGGSASDSETLKVKAAPVAPTVTLTLEPSQIAIGARAKLSWSSTNADSCKLSGSGSLYATSFNISIDESGYYWKGPFTSAGQATYTVTCTGAVGTTPATASATLTVVAEPPVILPPTVTLTLGASQIEAGATTTATWTSTNATECTLGTGTVSGTTTIGPYAVGSYAIEILCVGAGGEATDIETLTVVAAPPPAPTVTLALGASEIQPGATTTATWSSTNATQCSLGSGATSGSIVIGPYAVGTHQVEVTCTGAGGQATASQSLTVLAPPPDVVAVCAISKLGGVLEQTWVVDYDRSTGHFTGATLDLVSITGDISPANGLFTVGSHIDFVSGGGESGTGTAVLGQGAGVTALSRYNVTITLGNVTIPGATISFTGTCAELEGR